MYINVSMTKNNTVWCR